MCCWFSADVYRKVVRLNLYCRVILFLKVMVCQSPGKTRFRALKYETGDANRPAIVVRVIACFQPMDNCQAEYFRLLLKPVT